MPLPAGSAFIDFVPRLADGFGRKLSAELNPETEAAANKAGDVFKKAFAAFGLAAGAVLSKGLMDSVNTEAMNDKIAAGLGLSENVAAKAGAAAGELYSQAYGSSMDEVNAAIAAVGRGVVDLNTVSQAELQKITAKALDLATAMDLDVGEAVRTVGILMKTGLAKDSTEAFDLITAGLQAVPPIMRGPLLDAVNEYSVYLKEMGFTGNEAFGILAKAATGGEIALDKTVDAIKEANLKLTDMSTSSVEAYRIIGLNAEDMATKILAGGDTAKTAFGQIINAILAVEDPIQQEIAAVGLFGTQFEDLGDIDALRILDPMKSGLDNVAGAADRLGTTLNDNAKTKAVALYRDGLLVVQQFVSDKLLPVLVNELIPTVANLGQTFATAMNFINDNSTTFKVVAAIIATIFIPGLIAAGVTATVQAGVAVTAWVWMQVQSSINAVKIVASWVLTSAGAIAAGVVMGVQAAFQVAQWIWMGVQSTLQAARVAAAWLVAMGPIGWVTAAVIAVVALIILNWDKIAAATDWLWEHVKEGTKIALDWVTDKIAQAFDWIKWAFTHLFPLGILISNFDRIRDAAGAAFNWITDRVHSFVSFFSNLKISVGDIFGGIRDAFRNALNWIIDKWNNLSFTLPQGEAFGVTVGGGRLDTPNIDRFEKGGVAKGLSLVGEQGAELVNFSSPTRVFNNEDTKKLLSGSSETHYHFAPEITVQEKPDVDAEYRRMMALTRTRGVEIG